MRSAQAIKIISVDTPGGVIQFSPFFTDGEIGHLKLTTGRIDSHLPPGMGVIDCVGVLLQFSVVKAITEFRFSGSWEDLEQEVYTNTGEGLDAWEWVHNQHLIMVGTEDAESLNARMQLTPLDPKDYPITLQKNKVGICLKDLSAGSSYSLHFIVAWNLYPEVPESSCWYAVDIAHTKVLERLQNAG